MCSYYDTSIPHETKTNLDTYFDKIDNSYYLKFCYFHKLFTDGAIYINNGGSEIELYLLIEDTFYSECEDKKDDDSGTIYVKNVARVI